MSSNNSIWATWATTLTDTHTILTYNTQSTSDAMRDFNENYERFSERMGLAPRGLVYKYLMIDDLEIEGKKQPKSFLDID